MVVPVGVVDLYITRINIAKRLPTRGGEGCTSYLTMHFENVIYQPVPTMQEEERFYHQPLSHRHKEETKGDR